MKESDENPIKDEDKTPEAMCSETELKIEPVANTDWATAPAAANDFGFYQNQAQGDFSTPIQGDQCVQQPQSEYTLDAQAPFAFQQQQLPLTYNPAFVPINNYWPDQTDFSDFQGDFIPSNEYYASAEQKWIH